MPKHGPRLGSPHRRGGFAFARGRRRYRSDQNQLAIRLVRQRLDEVRVDLGFVMPVGNQRFVWNTYFRGNLSNGSDLRRLGDFDVTLYAHVQYPFADGIGCVPNRGRIL
jgi:hypothetical protein